MEAKKPTRDDEQTIRQSQLERAIELFRLFQIKPSLREVLRLSQILTDFQYNWDLNSYEIIKFEKHFNLQTNKDVINSVPHINTEEPQVDKPSPYRLQQANKLKGKS